MSKEKKVVVPSEEEVAKYSEGSHEGSTSGTDSGRAEAAGTSEQAQPGESDWKDLALRARAELSNYQKRTEKDRADALRYANAHLMRALLPIIDNLERIVQTGASVEKGAGAQAVIDGARLTLDMFHKLLGEFQVERIVSDGQLFDPTVHEAMMEQPADHPERTVLQEVAKGYRLHDRVLRPAKVIVSKPTLPAGETKE